MHRCHSLETQAQSWQQMGGLNTIADFTTSIAVADDKKDSVPVAVDVLIQDDGVISTHGDIKRAVASS